MISLQLVRFCIIGLLITGIDFCTYLMLRHEGLSILWANMLSTSFALAWGMLLHRKFTFQYTDSLNHADRIRYIIITLSGLWLLQPLVIYTILHLDTLLPLSSIIATVTGHKPLIADLLPKTIATGASAAWNYTLYKKLVFAPTTEKS